MPRRVQGKDGAIAYVEFTLDEMAQALSVEQGGINADIDPEDLQTWTGAIPAAREQDGALVYIVRSKGELELLRKRALILRTGMSERALNNIEKEGVLDAYAALAADTPQGLTAHVWRSYGLVVLMQVRHGVKIDAEELARRARLAERDPKTGKEVLGVEMAKKHLRLLQALGYLKSVDQGAPTRVGDKTVPAPEARWEHKGLPRAWRR
jgi:hypothetical protein